MNLKKLKKGETAYIIDLKKDDKKILKTLLAYGLLPGVKIRVIKRYPRIVVELFNTRFILDDNAAESVIVESNQDK